eukprot:c42254_g1_i1 orf=3-161(-)
MEWRLGPPLLDVEWVRCPPHYSAIQRNGGTVPMPCLANAHELCAVISHALSGC